MVDPKFLDTNYLVRNVAICTSCNNHLTPINQETKGRTSGNRLYACKSDKCKQLRIKAEVFDNVLKERIRSELNRFAGTSLVNKIKIGLNNDIDKLNKKYKIIQDGIEQNNKKQREIEYKIHKLTHLEFSENNRNFIESFTLFKIDLSKKVEFLEQELQNISKQKELINEVLTNENYWLPIINALKKQREDICKHEWRLLVTEIVSAIEIKKISNQKFKVEVRFKYDLPSFQFTHNEALEEKRGTQYLLF
ncbi:hypothetical protein AWH56_002030 [Anaerobacillus isosaccharinicus]|uniref:Recombinase zinc beta ribbon domain-containing protein n=1 Tax=Anaerobacillus isosaccharinicus TaxID=1532552 RepID=A0A7S7L8X6_9BACI|nr:hypothetical protein [Anaerobacillus isosaccharinicus]MBA5585172.1 hypothetical protein [Anaerobacillus isosaccharinicus]QOY36491.1 hypothetical protein AWH56_002030 [Anaerobacillus isosaccharinicus]